MAELIEVQKDEGSLDAFNQPTEETTAATTATTEPESQTTEPAIPEKYKGKTFDDIVRMHQEAEKLIGRQAQEVGEVRKLADDLIKQQLNTNKQDTQPSSEDNEIDYFADPSKAVNHAVENNPIVKQLKEQAELQHRQQGAARLQEKFPGYLDVVNSEDFLNWVKSSKVRIDLFTKANNFDFDSAEELLETFTTIKGIKAQNAQKADADLVKTEQATRSQALKSAAVQKGGTGEVSKPVYKRVDLIRLRMQDPNRYNDMHEEIMRAYAEGRVK
jgi:hypothetical protein